MQTKSAPDDEPGEQVRSWKHERSQIELDGLLTTYSGERGESRTEPGEKQWPDMCRSKGTTDPAVKGVTGGNRIVTETS